MPFADAEFDIVVSAGALTQTADKGGILTEVLRILRPGGWFSVYDWMKTEGEYSADMLHWFELEGLTYAMVTLDEQAALMREAGFTDVETEDATDWYRREARAEYDRLRGELYAPMVELIGQADADHFVENWRVMAAVIDQGEMRQAYCRGRKPPTG